MKCEKCGRAEATCHYSSNINGRITESHLCPECASECEWGRGMFGETEKMLAGMMHGFDSFFGDMHRALPGFGTFGFEPFFPSLGGFSRSAAGLCDRPAQTEGCSCGCNAEPKANAEVDAELAKKREINELREQMKAYAEKEEFENAAEIRDKLRELEK